MKIEKREKFVQINKIQGYEGIKDQYWISNSDEDVIINRNTGKQLKGNLDNRGYKAVSLQAKDGKQKKCRIHVIKAKAFLFGPNPLGANVVRHLDDCKTNNALINLAFGTQSDNNLDCVRNGNYNYEGAIKGGAIGRAVTAKKLSKPVRCVETGIIYSSAHEVERQIGISNSKINLCCNGKRQTAGGFHWEFVNQIAE